LAIVDGHAVATMRSLNPIADPNTWFELGEPSTKPLTHLDAIMMRKDPPFDSEYIYSTYILENAERKGTLIVNKPESLRDCNEKVFATQFPQFCPPLIVSRDIARLRGFYADHKDVIYKPLDGMGGTAI